MHIDLPVDDYIEGASDTVLVDEVVRRIANGAFTAAPIFDNREPWTRCGLAADIRAAFYARDASRLEHLLVVLERHET